MIENKPLKILKTVSAALYSLYFINIVINNVYSDIGVVNGLIERYGNFGYFLTYAIIFLLSGGFFVIPTAIQIIIFPGINIPSRKKITALAIIESIKIVGTAVCIFTVDLVQLIFNGFDAQMFFIITGIVLFVVISVLEIAVLIVINTEKKKSEGA